MTAQAFLATLILLHGTTVMILLLNIKIKKLSSWKKTFFFSGIFLIILANIITSITFGAETYGKYYTLTAQIPVFILLYIVSEYKIIKVLFSILTAIFLSFPVAMFYGVIRHILHINSWSLILLGSILTCVFCILLVCRFFKPNFNYMMENYDDKDVIKFLFVPIVYNLLSYSLGKYNYSNTTNISVFPMRTLLFVVTVSVYFLFLDILKGTREKNILENEKNIISIQMSTAEQHLVQMQNTQEATLRYRHDLRHHLALLNGFSDEGDLDKIKNYLKNIQADLDEITPKIYCLNNTVNLIFSSFVTKAAKLGVILDIKSDLPQALPLPETELCAILSNGLENAITAACNTLLDEKIIHINCHTLRGNLLIYMENPYVGEIIIKNGIPQTYRNNHGFGVKSIQMLTKKYNGYFSFTAKDNVFILKIVLPIEK